MIQIQNLESAIPASVIPSMGPEVLQSILGNVAESARNHWIKHAGNDTSVFRNDYISGIQPVVPRGEKSQVISLVGEVPHMLEDGQESLDMRTTLLGPNVPVAPMGERGKHRNKDGGYFRAIPFRHTIPDSGKTVGQAMGSAYSGHDAVSDAKKLGSEVYKNAKELLPTKTDPYGKTTWGGRLKTSQISAGLNEGIKGIPLLRPHHKSSIYEGMVREEKTYEKATQSQYVTFRTISTSVQDGSWIRKPIEARHYADKVNDFVAKILPKAIAAYVGGNA